MAVAEKTADPLVSAVTEAELLEEESSSLLLQANAIVNRKAKAPNKINFVFFIFLFIILKHGLFSKSI